MAEQENERELEKKTQSDVNTMREAISSIVNIFTEIPDHDIDGSPSVERKEALKALTPLSTNYVKNSVCYMFFKVYCHFISFLSLLCI